MWNEIREKAKLSLFPSILVAKTSNANHDSIPSFDKLDEDSFPLSKPASQAAIDQWKFIIDMFIQNGLTN